MRKKRIALLGTLMLAACLAGVANESATFGETGSEELSLGGQWQFSIDPDKDADKEWLAPDYDATAWDALTVPGNWDTENAYATFKGTGYYRKRFVAPAEWTGDVVRLCFGAVYQKAEVWLNGHYLGDHVGGYTPFEFDVSAIVKPGEENVIALTANNEYGRGAWWHWGGISREVTLVRNNAQRIVRQQIIAEPDLEQGTATVTASVILQNHSDADYSGLLTSAIFNQAEETAVGNEATQEITVPAKGQATVTMEFTLGQAETTLWDVENPNLYTLKTGLAGATPGNPVHLVSDRFGIRKIETKGAQLLLNGKAIHLDGFNRVSDHRAYGQTEPDSLVKFDIDAMKAMGCNFTRIMHYPQATNLLDYCDEVGMLLIEEIPVWGKGDPQIIPDNPLTQQWLKEMIERDFNHPSIIGWSVANEIADGDKEGRKMTPKVYSYVETMFEHIDTLDTTRLKTYVSFTVGNAGKTGVDPADLCDIVCFNSYGDASKVAKRCHEVWPDKPIFVSEIGKGQLELGLDSELADSLIAAIENLEDLDYVVGSSLWTFNDYRSDYEGTPASGNRAWGVYNVWRQPRKATVQIQKLYASSGKAELPTMDAARPKSDGQPPVIWTVVPLENSCMVGFSVEDAKEAFEIEYTLAGGEPKTMDVAGLRGAAKIYDLASGTYSIRIRNVIENGRWLPPHAVTID